MGSRPSSTIIYGFEYTEDWESDEPSPDFSYDHREEWEEACLVDAGVPAKCPDDVEWRAWFDSGRDAVRTRGTCIPWGYMEEPNHAIGFILAAGDWEAAEPLSALKVPDNAEALLRKVCEFYGVAYQEPEFLMLSSYP